jgi:ubiquinone/menaquinone biosynthesis C-methylase UbiE
MPSPSELHDQKYRAAKLAGLPGWGGAERISQLARLIDERFFGFKETPRSGRLLELGCGAGNLSIALSNRGFEVFGVDFSESAISWALENATAVKARVDFRVADVTELSFFPDGFFDVLYDGNCFHCILGESRRKALSEWRRILKKQGMLFISSLCASETDSSFPKEFDPVTRILTESSIPYRQIPTADAIERELSEAGFEILNSKVRTDSPFGHINIHVRRG